jgi:hypothetical protein
MQHLPLELQDLILHHLSPSLTDLKTLRLLNTHYHQVATPHLFRTVSLNLQQSSFTNFKQICDSASLAQQVRSLHYNIWEVPLVQEGEWDRAVERLLRRGGQREREEGAVIRYEDYVEFYRGQVLRDESKELQVAFRCLTGLRKLEVSEREPHDLLVSDKGGGQGRLVRCRLRLSAVLAEASRCLEYVPSHPHHQRASGSKEKVSRTLNLIIAHGAVASGSLRELTLEGLRWHWLDVRDVRMWHEEGMLNEALKGLRRLRIQVAGVGGDDGDEVDIPDPVAAREVWRALVGSAGWLKEVQVEVGLDDGRSV